MACGFSVRIGFQGPVGKLSGGFSKRVCGLMTLALRMTLAFDLGFFVLGPCGIQLGATVELNDCGKWVLQIRHLEALFA